MRKREDTADGCRALADADLGRAEVMANPKMRAAMERSARAWTARSLMLARLEASFKARAHAQDCSVSQS